MARVLRPSGRLLLVEFGGSAASKRGLFGHMHAHRRFDLAEEISGLKDVGLSICRGQAPGNWLPVGLGIVEALIGPRS